MEPIASFVGILGLVIAFKQQRESTDQGVTLKDFEEWLRVSGLREIEYSIEANYATSVSVKALLTSALSEIRESLQSIDASLANFASTFDVVGDLARAVAPEAMLSSQAFAILCALERSGATTLHCIRSSTSPAGVTLLLAPGGEVEIQEPRFIDDDLTRLVAAGLMKEQSGHSGSQKTYKPTRLGAQLARGKLSEENLSSPASG